MRSLSLFAFSVFVLLTPICLGNESVSKNNWNNLLNVLNQGVYETRLLAPHVDITKKYSAELKEISQAWARRGPKKEENIFFHHQIKKLNQQTLTSIEAITKSSRTKPADYRELAAKVLNDIDKNPVANLENTVQRPDGDQIGYCFGRAMLAHYLLLKAGVPQSDIVKIFNLGELMVEGVLWNFHVSVFVRDQKDGFIAVDPLQKKVLPYKDWLGVNERYDLKSPQSRARFYLTDPRKFLPSSGVYAPAELNHPVLRDYFSKLFN